MALTGPVSGPTVRFSLQTQHTGDHVCVASPLTGWEPTLCLAEAWPGHYERRIPEPWLEELPYKFVVNGAWQVDPVNPRQVPDGQGGSNSLYELSFREDPALLPPQGFAPLFQQVGVTDFDGQPHGGVTAFRVGAGPLKVVTFLDGGDFLAASSAAVLANLAAELHVEFLAVFVSPKDRLREYGLNSAYAKWMADVLTPAVEAQMAPGAKLTAADRLLVGPSLGGLEVVLAGFNHPGAFANIASLSGAFWWENSGLLKLVRQVPVKFYFDFGIYEGSGILESNRKMRFLAKKVGLNFTMTEYPSLHNWTAWRNRLSDVLRYFFAGP